jgi:hypothetical protein
VEPLTLFTKDDDPINVNDVGKNLHHLHQIATGMKHQIAI